MKLCLSSSENSGVEIVYGLKLLRHFAAILSHSHPRAHSQLQYAQSAAVKTLKHMLFHNLWIEFGMAITWRLKPRHPRSTKFRLLNWMISNLFYQLSLAQQKHDETGLRPSPPPPPSAWNCESMMNYTVFYYAYYYYKIIILLFAVVQIFLERNKWMLHFSRKLARGILEGGRGLDKWFMLLHV